MNLIRDIFSRSAMLHPSETIILLVLVFVMIVPLDYFTLKTHARNSEIPERKPLTVTQTAPQDTTLNFEDEPLIISSSEELDSIPPTIVTADDYPYGLDGKRPFNPSPTRAVWLSALFPGLGQIYNRRFWKIPIVIGGFMGLGYATNWNNSQYQDYIQGYRDLTDSDPNTKSYLDFFPPTVNESSLDLNWLTRTFKSRRDYFRRNRDLCIICLVALYLVCMIDAYIDASMAHFDISPNLSLDLSPTLLVQPATRKPALGINWAFNF